MEHRKHAQLVTNLLARSKSGAVDWKPGVQNETFQVSFRDNSVLVRCLDGHSGAEIWIEIRNRLGEVVETFSHHDLKFEPLFEQFDQNSFDIMVELYQLARRKAFGADKVLDDILEEIDNLTPH